MIDGNRAVLVHELVHEMANHLAAGEESAVEFLNAAFKTKGLVSKLTSMAQTSEMYITLRTVYDNLDDLLKPLCPECHVRAERFITSPAELYAPEMAELPYGATRRWMGEWYCPKCRHVVAVSEKWWAETG